LGDHRGFLIDRARTGLILNVVEVWCSCSDNSRKLLK
jgi:hypothetical protein